MLKPSSKRGGGGGGGGGLVTWVRAALTCGLRRRVAEDWEPVEIDPGLFQGSLVATKNGAAVLKQLGVTTVLTVMVEDHEDMTPEFSQLVIPVFDVIEETILEHFDRATEYIDQGLRFGKVYVHCVKGKSRSVTMVIAYLIKHRRMRLKKALATVRCVRPSAQPNIAFMKQLKEWERRCWQRG